MCASDGSIYLTEIIKCSSSKLTSRSKRIISFQDENEDNFEKYLRFLKDNFEKYPHFSVKILESCNYLLELFVKAIQSF